jgi:ATP-dependent DNA helicase RecQ
VLALTATATPEVVDDILRQLAIEGAEVVNTGIDRPNLVFQVRRTVNDDAKWEALAEIVDRSRGVGIVYVATVAEADAVYARLAATGLPAGRYHARMRAADRQETQRGFMADEYRVIVATKAFGLGIDKPDIRFVVHWQFPDSLETYVQEAGRAGRDGKRARAMLFYRLEDKRIQSYFLGGRYPRRDESIAVWRAIRRLAAGSPAGCTLHDVDEASGLGEKRTKVIVAQLVGAGVLKRARRSTSCGSSGTPKSSRASSANTRHAMRTTGRGSRP